MAVISPAGHLASVVAGVLFAGFLNGQTMVALGGVSSYFKVLEIGMFHSRSVGVEDVCGPILDPLHGAFLIVDLAA